MQSIIENKKSELINVCKLLDIERMYVFGSVTNDNFTIDSDIDFLISFSENIGIDKYTDNYFQLHYKLSELFNRNIDVITENSLSNPYFIQSLNDSKVLIYEFRN